MTVTMLWIVVAGGFGDMGLTKPARPYIAARENRE